MAKIPGDIQKWNKRWGTDVKYCFPSGGGAVGVVFVYTSVSNWTGANGSQGAYAPKDAAFVIKPIQGSAAPAKFAEHILSKIGGAQSPHSVPIKGLTIYAQSLINMLVRFSIIETDPKIKARWREVLQFYQNADTLLIQETQKAINELGDQYREAGGLTAFISDQQLMTNLGKLFAADALIGNGDRLYSMNAGNIIYNPHTRKFSAIDSTTIMTNFQAILNDSSGLAASGNMTPLHWAEKDIVNKGWGAIPSATQQSQYNATGAMPALPNSMPAKSVFSPKDWFNNTFKWHFRSAPDSPPANVWFQAELWFTAGVKQGIGLIDSKLSGINWMLMKNKYKSYVSRYGGDANLDWTNFKIRRKYIKLRKGGMPEEQVMQVIQDYVRRKFHLAPDA